jgi:glycosyltransferase involved in cell wall biosynthesis
MADPQGSGRSQTGGSSPASITVFFPCYNEQGNVARVAEQAEGVLKGIGADYEIILVDDGSADDTGRIADQIAAANKRVRVVHHEHNQGYGAALQSGFRAATKDLVFFSDGDGQFDLAELPPFLPLIRQYDIVIGYRLNRQDNWSRKIMGRAWTWLTCLLFSLRVRDVDCAFKLFKRDIFNHIIMESTGALISIEILARAHRAGYTITERGVHHRPRTAGRQTGAKLSVIARAFVELLKLRRRILKGQ